VTVRVLHTPPSPADSALVSSAGRFFFGFFFFAFVLYIPLVSPIQYVCVLLKFY
jgi:hypothetical protein